MVAADQWSTGNCIKITSDWLEDYTSCNSYPIT